MNLQIFLSFQYPFLLSTDLFLFDQLHLNCLQNIHLKVVEFLDDNLAHTLIENELNILYNLL